MLGPDVDLVATDAGPPALRRAVERADAVINLAGAPILGRWSKRRRRQIIASRLDTTEALVAAMGAASSRPGVLVSASAIDYYGDRGPAWVDEDSEAGDGFLANLCREWERAAMRASSLGVRTVVPRFGVVLGAGGGALSAMQPAFRAGLGGPLGSGQQMLSWIHLDDLLDILTRAITDERLRGPLNATAPNPVTQRAFARTLGRLLHRPAVLPVPAAALRLALGPTAASVLASKRVRPRRLEELGHRWRFDVVSDALADILSAGDDVRIDVAREWPDSPYLARRSPRYVLTQTTAVAAPIDRVFPFFSDPENLAVITPPDLGFSVEAEHAGMGPGARLDHRIRVAAIPLTWKTVIERWEPGRLFVDTQHGGPYRCWWHEHRFTPRGRTTLMEDRVFYAPPGGVLGRVLNRLFIAPRLRAIFGYRRRAIERRFGLDRAVPAAA
jgi:uncharacterized protein (TIGR01777 family)